MAQYTDQLNRKIDLNGIPVRIVSLVPSQTELLADLGLEEEVIGITKFCVHPERWFRNKERIGGTKNINVEKIRALAPDIIIANKEENLQNQVRELETIAPVWVSDVRNIKDAAEMIQRIGHITGRKDGATAVIRQLQHDLAEIHTLVSPYPVIKTAYLIWKDPYMTVGSDTFIHEIMAVAGLQNVFSDSSRYPEVTAEQIRLSGAELVLLSSEPYPFREKHIVELSAQLPGMRIALADGEMFSWYGSRMLHLLSYLRVFLPGISGDKS